MSSSSQNTAKLNQQLKPLPQAEQGRVNYKAKYRQITPINFS